MADEPAHGNGDRTNKEVLASIEKKADGTQRWVDDLYNRLFGLPKDPSDTGALGAIREDIRQSFRRHNTDDDARWARHDQEQTRRDSEDAAREDKDVEGRRWRRTFLVALGSVLVAFATVIVLVVLR